MHLLRRTRSRLAGYAMASRYCTRFLVITMLPSIVETGILDIVPHTANLFLHATSSLWFGHPHRV